MDVSVKLFLMLLQQFLVLILPEYSFRCVTFLKLGQINNVCVHLLNTGTASWNQAAPTKDLHCYETSSFMEGSEILFYTNHASFLIYFMSPFPYLITLIQMYTFLLHVSLYLLYRNICDFIQNVKKHRSRMENIVIADMCSMHFNRTEILVREIGYENIVKLNISFSCSRLFFCLFPSYCRKTKEKKESAPVEVKWKLKARK